MSSLPVMQNGNGHSADVRMALLLNERVLPIAQLGPDFLFLVSPASHPPGLAEVLLSVDGHEERWTVRLPDGIQPADERVSVSRI
jgi:hypothetical protein